MFGKKISKKELANIEKISTEEESQIEDLITFEEEPDLRYIIKTFDIGL